MRRLSVILLFILCLTLLIVCGGCARKTYITFSEAGTITAKAETKTEGTVRVPAPAGTKAAFCVGWQAQSDEGTLFLPIGATYTYAEKEDKSFTPVYLRFTTNTTVTPILTETSDGICFTSTVNRADWEVLSTLAQSVTRGTLIFPTTLAQTLGTVTHAALASISAPTNAVDIVTDSWSAEDDNSLTFAATYTDIPDEYYTANYTAVGYIKITYTDGSEGYAYASYGEKGMPTAAFYSFSEMVQKYLSLTTASVPKLDLTAKNGGIHFVTSISKAKWQELINTSGRTLEYGTLIFPTADLSLIGGKLTHAALQEAKKTAFDIPSTTWLTDSEELAFGATLMNIPEFLRSTAYTAVGYIKITHVDQTVTYIYANHENDAQPSASLIALANAALLDLSDTETDLYQYTVGNQFSPYTEEERTTLQALSKFPVYLIIDDTIKGNRRLHEDYLTMYTEHLVYFADDSSSSSSAPSEEARAIYRALKDNIYSGGGALVITAKDGTELSADNLGDILLDYGTSMGTVKTYIFYNGSLVIPYKIYSRPV